MAERHILYCSAETQYLYRSVGGALELEAKFPADDSGVSAFGDYLGGRRGRLFSVLVDLTGEDFHEEQIPHLRGNDREAVLGRRLAQRYRDTRLAAALSLGTVAAGERKNERLLLASFTNTQQIAPWLDALVHAGARLAGVYSVPLLAPALAAGLGMRNGRCIVVSAHRAGLRQCFVDEGRVRFGRLERTADMAPQALAMFVRSETQRLAQYLATLRVLPREAGPLQVLVIAPPGQRAVFEQALNSDARLVFRTIDWAEAARAAGLVRVPEEALGEALYVQLCARKPPREQFAGQNDRRRFLIWQLQRGLVAAGALAFAACAVFAGARWLDASGLRERAADQSRQAQLSADQYRRITAGFPVTQTSSENLRATVVEFRRLAERSPAPETALLHISKLLQEFPQIELDAINWSVGKPERREAKPPAAAGGAKPEALGDTAVLVEISGRVNSTQREDYRGITAQVQRFAGGLSSAGYQLIATKLPFDITSEGMLSGDISAGTADTGEAPRFTITLARPLP
jgi:hypothetical protein